MPTLTAVANSDASGVLATIAHGAERRDVAPCARKRDELAPREVPSAPAAIQRIAPPQIERELAPSVGVAPHAVTVEPTSMERIAPPRVDGEITASPMLLESPPADGAGVEARTPSGAGTVA